MFSRTYLVLVGTASFIFSIALGPCLDRASSNDANSSFDQTLLDAVNLLQFSFYVLLFRFLIKRGCIKNQVSLCEEKYDGLPSFASNSLIWEKSFAATANTSDSLRSCYDSARIRVSLRTTVSLFRLRSDMSINGEAQEARPLEELRKTTKNGRLQERSVPVIKSQETHQDGFRLHPSPGENQPECLISAPILLCEDGREYTMTSNRENFKYLEQSR